MYSSQTPSLFGLQNSNRDFSLKEDWGKNVFNNAFPVSLTAYMGSRKLNPVYLTLNQELRVVHSQIAVEKIFGHDPLAKNIFFAFESLYMPYEPLVSTILPRIDLVTCTYSKGVLDKSLMGIEIKLTALPDNSTAEFDESEYGSEMVVRPDTIVYLALSIITNYMMNKDNLADILLPVTENIKEWNNPREIVAKIDQLKTAVNRVLLDSMEMQKPFLLQPIWKTKGKTLELEDNCLDTFIWSDYGFTRLFIDNIPSKDKINRPMRSCVWLAKMLHDFVKEGKISHSQTIRDITFGWQTDKAFAMSGRITRNYLRGPELLHPRVTKHELKNIILDGGEKMLSPERRFDSAILSNASLFN